MVIIQSLAGQSSLEQSFQCWQQFERPLHLILELHLHLAVVVYLFINQLRKLLSVRKGERTVTMMTNINYLLSFVIPSLPGTRLRNSPTSTRHVTWHKWRDYWLLLLLFGFQTRRLHWYILSTYLKNVLEVGTAGGQDDFMRLYVLTVAG